MYPLAACRPKGGAPPIIIPDLLRDEFLGVVAAGSVNGTLATDGVNTRVVVDTGSNLSLNNGLVAAGGVGYGNPGIWWDGQARTQGKTFIASWNVANAPWQDLLIGWDTGQSADISGNAFYISGGNLLIFDSGGGNAHQIGVYSFVTAYQVALVLRTAGAYYFIKGGAFTKWTLLHISGRSTTTPVYPGIANYATTFVSAKARIPGTLWLPKPLAYDTFHPGAPFFAIGDSKTALSTPDLWPGILDAGHLYTECTPRLATGGWYIDDVWDNIDAALLLLTRTPAYVLINLGVNDAIAGMTEGEAATKTKMTYILNAIHAKFPAAQVYWLRPGCRGKAANCTTLAGWIATVVGAFAWAHVGPDEQVFLENGDDYATYTDDGLHPNALGQALEAAQWTALLNLTDPGANLATTEALGPELQVTPQKSWESTAGCAVVSNNTAVITPTLGAELATGTLAVGTWYTITATEVDHFYTGSAVGQTFRATATTALDANNKVKALTLASAIAAVNAGTVDMIVRATPSAVPSGKQAGVIARLDSQTSPANFVVAYISLGKVRIFECVAGVYAALDDGTGYTQAFSAGDALSLHLSGTAWRLYYISNGGLTSALLGAGTTNVTTGTRAALFSSDATVIWTTFAAWAVGTGGEHEGLSAL